MKQRIKYAIEHGFQNLLQLFRVLPLRDRVVFMSFSGKQYSDSPRRISELLLRWEKKLDGPKDFQLVDEELL